MFFDMEKVINTENPASRRFFIAQRMPNFRHQSLRNGSLNKAVTKVTAIHWRLPGIRKGKRNPTAFR